MILRRWQDVIRDCNSVLALPNQASNVKALFRRSLARRETAEEDGALKGGDIDIKTALLLVPLLRYSS